MKQKSKKFVFLVLFLTGLTFLYGQQTVISTGGAASGIGGSVTFTVGQGAYQSFIVGNGIVAQGVEQSWEVSTPVAIENSEDISLELNVYPNPTSGSFKLIVLLIKLI